MLAGDAFLSFVRVRDPGRHGDYNRWHQLDHLPENRALPGIAFGERWVHRPACSAVARPVAVAPRLALSPEALPLLPAGGVHITVSRPHQPHGDGAEAAWRWHDRVGSALLETPGVAGVHLFSSVSTTLDRDWREAEGTTTFDAGEGERGQIRVRVCFLDGDPLDLGPAPGAPRPSEVEEAEELLFEGPLETIVPRRWDWFDDEIAGEAVGGDRI